MHMRVISQYSYQQVASGQADKKMYYLEFICLKILGQDAQK